MALKASPRLRKPDLQSYIGKRAVCSHGLLGTVTRVEVPDTDKDGDGLPVYYGVTEDGRPWQTIRPVWVHSSRRLAECHKTLSDLEGKIGKHGGFPTERSVAATLQFALGLPRIHSLAEVYFENCEPAAESIGGEPARGKTTQPQELVAA